VRRLNCEAQNGVVERVIRVVIQINVRIALDDGQSPRDAGIHAIALDLDAAAINPLGLNQQIQQRAVTATDVQHARVFRHHLRDEKMVDTGRRLQRLL